MEQMELIITVGSVVSVFAAFIGMLLKIHKFYLKQEEQSKEIEKLQAKYKSDIKQMKGENALICYSLSACLDGLQQLGANHTVPLAKEKLEIYLNNAAHDIDD